MEQETGQVYVVHNECIRNTKGGMPYKIGITKNTVSDRYYGLGLVMPGEFVCDFAYEFAKDYDKVETDLQNMLNLLCEKGEWFNINDKTLEGIRSICKKAGGRLVTDSVRKVIDESQNIQKELLFVHNNVKYFARLYKSKSSSGIYGEIRDDTNCKCSNMKGIARDFLKNKGIELPKDYNTHDAVRMLINFLEGKLK
jgi:hypothetical protein